MAFPTITGVYRYPYQNSPERTFYQGFNSGGTVGVMKILPTITTSGKFCLTKMFLNVSDPTAASTITIKLKTDTIAVLQGTAINSWQYDFSPSGIVSAEWATTTAATNTVELVIAGATCQASCYVLGYFI